MNIEKTERAIEATKKCTKVLMKLAYKNYLSNTSPDDSKISNRNIRNIENFKN